MKSDDAAVPPEPLRPGERIPTIDIVRGFALLGILIMNLPGFGASYYAESDGTHLWTSWWDRGAEEVRDVLFSGKFNSMFTFLFGLGFTMQLERLVRRAPERAAWIYTRRLLILFVFGLLHACLLWRGDVLHNYALLGFVLLAVRRIPDRAVLAIVAFGLLYPAISSAIYNATTTPADVQRLEADARAWAASNDRAYGSGTFVEAVIEQTRETVHVYTDPQERRWMVGWYVSLLTTMLLGFLAGRRRWIEDAARHLPRMRRIQWWALGVGLAAGLLWGIGTLDARPLEPSPFGPAFSTAYALCRVSLMVFYVVVIVRLALRPLWQERLRSIGAVGRMPLTNYLLQSLIGTFLFYGWGLGLWGQVGPAIQLGLAFAIFFLLQVPLSAWWFERFDYGPMEYLWRLLTYGRRPATAAAPEAAAPSGV